MPCKSYKQALSDAAAAGEAPSYQLAAHIEGCAACRTWFDEERQLYAMIDSTLKAAGNAPVPASLSVRVRNRLDELPVPRRFWLPARIAMVASAFALVLVGVLIHEVTIIRNRSNLFPLRASGGGASTKEIKPLTASVSRAAAGPTKKQRPPISLADSAARSRQIPVLIPAGQREAVDQLIAGLQTGSVRTDLLITAKPEQIGTLGIRPIAIPPIEIKALADTDQPWITETRETNR